MEGLDHGWKKSINQYHFFDIDSLISVCTRAEFKYSVHKKQEFLTEKEFTEDMDICRACYDERKELAQKKIIEESQKGFWDDSYVCPECKTPVIFWNSNQNKDHTCTICNKRVMLA